MLEKLLNYTQKTSVIMAWIGGTLIVLSSLLVTLEVFLRKIFNISLGGADELSGYAFAVATAFSLAYALFERAHIRVDALFNVMPQKIRPFVNFLGLILLIGFAFVIIFTAASLVGDTLENGSRSITPMRVPLAIPQIPWLFGWVFFVFSGVLLGLVALKHHLAGRHNDANKLIGIKTLDEQIEDETV